MRSAKEMHKTMKQKERESGSSEDDDSDSDDDTDPGVDCDVEKVNDKNKTEERKPMTCKYCFIIFRHKQACELHTKINHSSDYSSLRCELCGKTFKLQRSLQNHQEKHDNKEKKSCTICDKKYS